MNLLLEYLRPKNLISVDTETTGVGPDANVVGVSVCADIEKAYYIILSYWDKEQKKLIDLETKEEIHLLFKELKNKDLIMHNAVFDCQMISVNFKIDLIESVHTDTMILGHLLNESRHNGLKELGVSIFGEDASKEQKLMKESVLANGGVLTEDKYELYKADSELLAKYGAKDALLTQKLFYEFVDTLYVEGLDKFFYEDESMPLLKGPTYSLNTSGLRVDYEKLQNLRGTLEAECMQLKAFIHKEIAKHVSEKYPGTKPSNTFNIGAGKQLAWLLYSKLGEEFHVLTDGGKEVCKAFDLRVPYSAKDKRHFINVISDNVGNVYKEAEFNKKTGKMSRPKKVGNPWTYLACGKEAWAKHAHKYAWIKKLLEYSKNLKILNTYVIGIQERMRHNIIRPSFFQHGTPSGRYASRNPNFQNLPRDDKRVKACIVSRAGKSFVGADYDQLEAKVFASFSGDERLLNIFKTGDDFYSVIGMELFDKYDCTPKKEGSPEAFGVKYKKERTMAKVVALSSAYGTTANKMATATGKSIEECKDIIHSYFSKFPKVKQLMLDSHELAKQNGVVHNLFGRPRRLPAAKDITKIFGNQQHSDLPYEIRNILNVAINHRIQSTGASIINRASIAFHDAIKAAGIKECNLVLQVHDELIAECLDTNAKEVASILKRCMEDTTILPGVDLIAKPVIAKNLADLK